MMSVCLKILITIAMLNNKRRCDFNHLMSPKH